MSELDFKAASRAMPEPLLDKGQALMELVREYLETERCKDFNPYEEDPYYNGAMIALYDDFIGWVTEEYLP